MITSTTSRTLLAAPRTGSKMQNWSRRVFHLLLQRLEYGQIILVEGEQRTTFGSDESFHVTVRVHHPAFYSRVLFGGSIGAGEAYIAGYWDASCLTTLVRIIARNSALLDAMEERLAWLTRPWHRLRHLVRPNSRAGAKKNILAHYDLGNEMYRTFLDPTMMYSAAIYPAEDSTLEEAALYKLEHVCRKLDLRPDDRVIEIGSGWGGFAIYAATHYGCHVTTTTISDAQYREARERIDRAGLAGRITLLKQDYRELVGQYDKLVSLEMIEAVGHRYLPRFFAQCAALLKEDGMLLLQTITIKDQLFKRYINSVDFIQEYIFPGGCLTANRQLLDVIAGHTDMVVRSIEDFGLDYARTLRDWRERFHASFAKLERHGYDERFRRLWEFYLCYCEGGFAERSISVIQLTATRPGHRAPLPRP